jgi:hypothetical protein
MGTHLIFKQGCVILIYCVIVIYCVKYSDPLRYCDSLRHRWLLRYCDLLRYRFCTCPIRLHSWSSFAEAPAETWFSSKKLLPKPRLNLHIIAKFIQGHCSPPPATPLPNPLSSVTQYPLSSVKIYGGKNICRTVNTYKWRYIIGYIPPSPFLILPYSPAACLHRRRSWRSLLDSPEVLRRSRVSPHYRLNYSQEPEISWSRNPGLFSLP